MNNNGHLTTHSSSTDFAANDELSLVAAAQDGDTQAFDALVDHYAPRIFRLALNMMCSHEDAEEVMQEAFLSAFVHLKKFRKGSRFSTWLTRIAINQGLMTLRKRKPHQVALDEFTDTGRGFLPREVVDWGPTPEQRYSQNELRQVLANAMCHLTPALRVVFQLRDIDEFSTEETAHILGVSTAAVRARSLRARLELREHLNDYFRTPEVAQETQPAQGRRAS